jgi:thiamine pyrophosphate-dependent acetolactate synthase large subunit-like protein
VNPDFARFAELCGGRGFRVDDAASLPTALEEALAEEEVPSIVEVRTSGRWT